jgi:hypothetical protein
LRRDQAKVFKRKMKIGGKRGKREKKRKRKKSGNYNYSRCQVIFTKGGPFPG